ncbi:MAG: single-stranded DNA-binding protein [Oscillospiraceae bacterium]|nr:single-stranded DNA-binding protein [Oscillospiraceae bacterium]
MLNHIEIMGRLGRDPELRHTQSGTPVASFTVAVDRDFKDKSTGERATDWIDVVAWRSTGEFVSKYFSKGRMAVVEGRLQLRDWKDKEGNKRRSAEILASSAYFGDSKPKDGSSTGGKAGKDDDFQLPEGFGNGGDSFADLADDDGDLPF